MKIRINFDMDELCADFIRGVADSHLHITQEEPKQDWDFWEDYFETREDFENWLSHQPASWWANLPPAPSFWGMHNLWTHLRKRPDLEVDFRFLTHGSGYAARVGKEMWAEKNMDIEVVCVTSSKDKQNHFDPEYDLDVLIDDSGANCIEWPGLSIVIDKPWNRDISGVPRIRTDDPQMLHSQVLNILCLSPALVAGKGLSNRIEVVNGEYANVDQTKKLWDEFMAKENAEKEKLSEAQARKDTPLFSGVLRYFPDALLEVARTSKAGNDQHNPGTPLHWDRSKSGDELDALARHLIDAGTRDTDGIRHSAKVAWRALANLQKEIESERGEK